MDFEILSDIHTEELCFVPRFLPKAKCLILAGDIGNIQSKNFKTFFDWVSKKWKYIFYVLGNHEYHSNDKTSIEDMIIEYELFFLRYNNVFLLDRKYVILDNIKIMGCTLWSNFQTWEDGVQDFQKMYFNGKLLDHETYLKMHQKDREWLLKNYDNSIPTIIITHFPLIYDTRLVPPQHRNTKKLRWYFYNDIRLFTKYEQLICISGHTHWSHDFQIKMTWYISNQFGHQGEETNYDKDLTIELC